MRILLSTFTFPPNKDGVSEASAAAVRAFLSQGWSVEVATSPATPSRNALDWEGTRIHEFAIQGSPHFRNPYRGAIEDYRRFLSSGRWDVIVFEGYSWPLDLAAPLLDRISAKKVLVSHGYGALTWTPVVKFPFGLGALAFAVYRTIRMMGWIKKVDRWVFLSSRKDFRSFFDHWLACRLRHPGIRVISNGLDPARRGIGSRFRKSYGLPPDVLIFLCVGYFSSGKNQKMALQAYRQAGLPDSRLVFIAPESNPWMDQCKRADSACTSVARNSGVLWLTGLSREMTLDGFAASDIYLSSSIGETQPISILEAMRESKPWIAMRAGCISEFPGGLCVCTLQQMVSAMHKLGTQPGEREKFGQAGRQAVESQYSIDRFSSSYSALVEQLVPGVA